MTPLQLTIEGMTCAHCVRAVENRLRATPGVEVESVTIGAATLRHDAAQVSTEEITEAIADEGYTAFVA